MCNRGHVPEDNNNEMRLEIVNRMTIVDLKILSNSVIIIEDHYRSSSVTFSRVIVDDDVLKFSHGPLSRAVKIWHNRSFEF